MASAEPQKDAGAVDEFAPRISIVIPVYNGANYLGEAIDSALAQTYSNVEVLVVDDGSTDNGQTERIARRYGEHIRYIQKENGGVASALNLGIQEMTGEYFSWLSHDDVYHPDKLTVQIECLRQSDNRDTVLYGAYERIDKFSVVTGNSLDEPRHEDAVLAILATMIGGCTTLVPRRCFEIVGGFNEALPSTQDNEMWLRIALAGFPFRYINQPLIQSRHHAEQGSMTMPHHARERERSYLWAISAIGPVRCAAFRHEFAQILMHKEHPRAFLSLLGSIRREVGMSEVLHLLCQHLPRYGKRRSFDYLRSSFRGRWMNRRFVRAGSP